MVLGGGVDDQRGKYMSLGNKNEEKRRKGKKLHKREKIPPKFSLFMGARLIILVEWEGGII